MLDTNEEAKNDLCCVEIGIEGIGLFIKREIIDVVGSFIWLPLGLGLANYGSPEDIVTELTVFPLIEADDPQLTSTYFEYLFFRNQGLKQLKKKTQSIDWAKLLENFNTIN